MKTLLKRRFWLGSLIALFAVALQLRADTNIPPTATVLSAVQRPGTTYMDIDFRVDDPDDATVEVRALAFQNGGANFSDIIKISTLMEGTAANLGTNVAANTPHHLTWNVAADWNINFGNVQVEILAKDNRRLLPFNWVTLPAHGSDVALTLNNRPIYDTDLLPVWYWLIATNDPSLALSNGVIYGVTGDYQWKALATGTATTSWGRDYMGFQLGFGWVAKAEINRAQAGPFGSQTVFQGINLNSVTKGYRQAKSFVYGWGGGIPDIINLPGSGGLEFRALALGTDFTLALLTDGTVFEWGGNAPDNATNVIAIAAGDMHNLALRADGTVIAWGDNSSGQLNVPDWFHTYNAITAIAAGEYHSLALRVDGKVIAWGDNSSGQLNVPAANYNNFITAIAAGYGHSLALRADGTVIAWGDNSGGQLNVPATATNVIAIAAGGMHNLALRADGTVVAWGANYSGQLNVPPGLTGIELIGVGAADRAVAVGKRSP